MTEKSFIQQSEDLLAALRSRSGYKMVNRCPIHDCSVTRKRTQNGKRYICRKCTNEAKKIMEAIDLVKNRVPEKSVEQEEVETTPNAELISEK